MVITVMSQPRIRRFGLEYYIVIRTITSDLKTREIIMVT